MDTTNFFAAIVYVRHPDFDVLRAISEHELFYIPEEEEDNRECGEPLKKRRKLSSSGYPEELIEPVSAGLYESYFYVTQRLSVLSDIRSYFAVSKQYPEATFSISLRHCYVTACWEFSLVSGRLVNFGEYPYTNIDENDNELRVVRREGKTSNSNFNTSPPETNFSCSSPEPLPIEHEDILFGPDLLEITRRKAEISSLFYKDLPKHVKLVIYDHVRKNKISVKMISLFIRLLSYTLNNEMKKAVELCDFPNMGFEENLFIFTNNIVNLSALIRMTKKFLPVVLEKHSDLLDTLIQKKYVTAEDLVHEIILDAWYRTRPIPVVLKTPQPVIEVEAILTRCVDLMMKLNFDKTKIPKTGLCVLFTFVVMRRYNTRKDKKTLDFTKPVVPKKLK